DIFPILWLHHGVHGITLWGYRQGEIWRTNAYLIRSNGTERPALSWLKTYLANSDGGVLCTGVGTETRSARILIFPNPVQHKRLVLFVASDGYHLTVFDSLGRKYAEGGLAPGENVLELQAGPGVYHLLITAGDGRPIQRRIIIH
ncbi:MAG TPA: T9SS type A sorting domain-containing protein, partial [Chryseosolibacter sp.]|nr:T9SS type A sorting domain-containing protein [Chryseosolibacter sp.]